MPLTRITLRQLEAYAAVAELLNFHAAAERLGLTAQAVSQLVAELEAVLGFRLFDRTTRRVALSSAGRDYLASAETVLRHVRAAESTAADVRHRAAGVVRVGAPMVLAASALPEAVRAYVAGRPKVVVRIHDLPVEGLVEAVASGDVDLAVGPDRPVGDQVQRLPLFDSPWVLWCAGDHPLARRARLHWHDLRDAALVAAGRDHERSVAMMRLGAPEDARIVPVQVVEHISTALGIAAQGQAATLAPAYVQVLARHFGLVMRRVLGPETVRSVGLYQALGRQASPAALGFAEHLQAWLPQWHAGLEAASDR
ncbi:LysR family transcriptional regulator [Pseudorhodoferax sp. Leaf274]|uniref:LysR family transcriptional regulator n=1 Tax=Pseudorhodoferax sp. Leaf274 TaxID=1736318 RepID=UPI00070366D7|nr:LysR family transcriptional regulator [Pseudorhodoferax sp. Leaf274]KQP49242.1 LysR family transcriptional regulator [Pseudorhodoferax sp. Leaf274]